MSLIPIPLLLLKNNLALSFSDYSSLSLLASFLSLLLPSPILPLVKCIYIYAYIYMSLCLSLSIYIYIYIYIYPDLYIYMMTQKCGTLISENRSRMTSQLKKRKGISSTFCSIGYLRSLGNAYHTGEGGSLLSLLIQIIISSKNILSDTPQNSVLPAIWASLSLGKLTYKIYHHICVFLACIFRPSKILLC